MPKKSLAGVLGLLLVGLISTVIGFAEDSKENAGTEAARQLEEAVDLFKSAPTSKQEERERLERYRSCEELFHKIRAEFSRSPEAIDALFYLTECQRLLQRVELALEGFEQFLAAGGESKLRPDAWYGSGSCRQILGEWEKSLTNFDRVLADHPDASVIADVLYAAGVSQRQLGKFDEARALWDRLASSHSGSEPAQRAEANSGTLMPPKARLRQLSLDYKQAIRELGKAPGTARQDYLDKVESVLRRVGEVRNKDAERFLMGILKKEHESVRVLAIKPLLETGSKDASRFLLDLLTKGSPVTRWDILKGLQRRHLVGLPLKAIEAQLNHAEPAIRNDSYLLLGRIGSLAAVRTLIGSVATGKKLNDNARYYNGLIKKALHDVRDEKAIQFLSRKVLENRRQPIEVRRMVASVLGYTRATSAVSSLRKTLNERDAELAKASVGALGRLGARDALDDILVQLKKRKRDYPFVRAAVNALGELDPARAETELLEMSQTRDPELLPALIRVIGMIPSDACFARVLEALEDPSWRVRSAALEVAGNYPRRELVDVLVGRLDREEGPRLHPLFRLLIDLTGEDFGPDVARWKEYWNAIGDDFVVRQKQTVSKPGRTFVAKKKVDPKKARTPEYFGVDIISKRLVFIVDTSGSMSNPVTIPLDDGSEKEEIKMDLARSELLRVIEMLQKGTEFNLVRFADNHTSMARKLVKLSGKTKSKAKKFVQGLSAQGGTNIYDTLEHVLKTEQIDTIFFLSDGAPSMGKYTEPNQILDEIARLNSAGQVVIHTITVGYESEFMRKLAAHNRGEYIVAGKNK